MHRGTTEIGAELGALLREVVVSYEHLDTLLLLRQRPDQVASANAVGEALHIPTAAAEEALEDLCGCDLLEARPLPSGRVFRYRPGTARLSQLVDELAELWNGSRLALMNAMTSNAMGRLRTQALHTFADAFLVGRGKKSDG